MWQVDEHRMFVGGVKGMVIRCLWGGGSRWMTIRFLWGMGAGVFLCIT